MIKIFVLCHGCALLSKALGIQHQLSSVSVGTVTDQAGLFGNVSELYSGGVQFDTGRGTIMTDFCASLYSAVHTRTTGKYADITPTTSMSTETIDPLL